MFFDLLSLLGIKEITDILKKLPSICKVSYGEWRMELSHFILPFLFLYSGTFLVVINLENEKIFLKSKLKKLELDGIFESI